MTTKKKKPAAKKAAVAKEPKEKKVKVQKAVPQDYYYTALTWSSVNMGGGTVSRIHNQVHGSVFSIFQATNIIHDYMEQQGARNVVVVLNNFQRLTRAEAELYEREFAIDFEKRKAAAIKEAEAVQAAAEKLAKDQADSAAEAKEAPVETEAEVIPMRAEVAEEAAAE